jgi:hypothetical protein
VATAHIVVLFAALVTLLGARQAFAAVRRAERRQGDSGVLAGRLNEPAVRRAWLQRCGQDAEALRDLDRALRATDPLPAAADRNPPPIEQLAFDLRRLHRQRRTGPTRESQRWLAEVQRAYDVRLRMACRCLDVPEHLEPLEGVDRDIERIRVEDQLEAAGLTLRS